MYCVHAFNVPEYETGSLEVILCGGIHSSYSLVCVNVVYGYFPCRLLRACVLGPCCFQLVDEIVTV